MTVVAVGVRDDRFLKEVVQRSAAVLTDAPTGEADLVFFGAENRAALDKLPALRSLIKPDGALWVIRPKGQTINHGVGRDDGGEAGRPGGT